MVRITFEKYVSKVQKSEKQSIEISIRVKKKQNYFFLQEMRACATADNFFFQLQAKNTGKRVIQVSQS